MNLSQENRLEDLLRLAANEPAHRPEFITTLLDSTVFILGSSDRSDADHSEVFGEGTKVQIQHWEYKNGVPVIPFFSSLEVLHQSIETEESYLALSARALFELTLGATLFLNPKSDYGKEFLPGEIENILSTGQSNLPEQRVVEKPTKVLLGQPSNYPAKMVDSLTQLFTKYHQVKRAYLALMHDPSIDEVPRLIVGIDGDRDLESVIHAAGQVAVDTAPEGEPVDFYQVDANNDGISQYFINDVAPFYERRWGQKLRSWLGTGNA